MARYTGPKTKKARSFGEPIYGYSKAFEKKKYPPGHHGNTRRRRQKSDYALQLMEKQKAKYTYGVLERQFRNLFNRKKKKKGVTGEVLLQLLEMRLDNTVFRMTMAPTVPGARQLVNHGHVTVNGRVLNIPSYQCKPGDVIAVRDRDKSRQLVTQNLDSPGLAHLPSHLEFNKDTLVGKVNGIVEREWVALQINELLVVEYYSRKV